MNFSHYISLGYFCSVAMDLEKLGLRTESSPFDWLISDFEGVMKAIEDNFVDFLNYEFLYQSKANPTYYKNAKYDVQFFHDFNKYKKLKNQLPDVQEKYEKRIKRFYSSISEPTLFIRYISNEETPDKKGTEISFIENNYDHIRNVLKSFNEQNEIIFIANQGVSSQIVKVYHVEKENGDVVARSPICENHTLLDLFSKFDVPNKQENMMRYIKKEKEKNKAVNRYKRKLISICKRVFLRIYIHEKQY